MRTDPRTQAVSITPLDKSMLGKTYVTKYGKPLGERGLIDIAAIIARAKEIETRVGRTCYRDMIKKGLSGDKGNGVPQL